MGINYEDILGERCEFFVKDETTPGTFEFPLATTDGMDVKTADMTPSIVRKNRRDAYQATRGTFERITGKSEYGWSVDAFYTPSGDKDTDPDCGPFIHALLGTRDDNADDITYSQSSSQTLRTLTLVRNFQDIYQEAMWGALVDTMTIKCAGGDEPQIHFDGRAMGFAATGYGTLSAAMVATDAMIVQAADANMFAENSVVKIAADDGTGDFGYRVSVDTSAPTFTIVDSAGVVSIAAADDAIVVPHTPAHGAIGSPATGITGSLTWDGLDLSEIVTGFELTAKANNEYHDNAAFQQDLSDATPGFFDFTGKIDLRLRKDMLVKLLDRKTFATRALTVILGTSAAALGTRAELSMPYCEMDFTNVTIPESGVATVSIPFMLLESAGNDAFTWKHT